MNNPTDFSTIELVRRARPGDLLDLTLTAEELETLAQAYLARKADLDIRSLRITLDGLAVLIEGNTSLLGREVTISVRAIPQALKGQIDVKLEGVLIGGTPAPRFAVSEIATFLRDKLASPKFPLDVESIAVTENGVRISARRTSEQPET